MTLKIAVLAPIARAIVTTTVIVNTGFLRSVRNAKEKSFNMVEEFRLSSDFHSRGICFVVLFFGTFGVSLLEKKVFHSPNRSH